MYLRFLAVFAFVFASLSVQAQAQNVEQYVPISPPEDRVLHHQPASGPFDPAADEDRIFRWLCRKVSEEQQSPFSRAHLSCEGSELLETVCSLGGGLSFADHV